MMSRRLLVGRGLVGREGRVAKGEKHGLKIIFMGAGGFLAGLRNVVGVWGAGGLWGSGHSSVVVVPRAGALSTGLR